MAPTAAVSDIEVPLIPAKNMLVTMLTAASPPRIWPTIVRAKSTRRAEMPLWFMIEPARMNSGTARSGKLLTPW